MRIFIGISATVDTFSKKVIISWRRHSEWYETIDRYDFEEATWFAAGI